MAAEDVQHLYSLPFDRMPMASNNYNDLQNRPKINGVTLTGDKSLSDLGVPTKTSELVNDENFAKVSQIPNKTSDLVNDSDYTTKAYVDEQVDAINNTISDIDGIVTVKHFLSEETFSSTFDNLATALSTKLATLQANLLTDEFIEIKTLRINTIGNCKPSKTILIDENTDLLSLVIDWQGFSYNNNVVQAIDVVNKKVLNLTMTNDTNNDGFVSYFDDATAYTFTIEYAVYKTVRLS